MKFYLTRSYYWVVIGGKVVIVEYSNLTAFRGVQGFGIKIINNGFSIEDCTQRNPEIIRHNQIYSSRNRFHPPYWDHKQRLSPHVSPEHPGRVRMHPSHELGRLGAGG